MHSDLNLDPICDNKTCAEHMLNLEIPLLVTIKWIE